MKWIEVKKILDETAEQLFLKYVARVDSEGFSFLDEDSLNAVMPAANTFLFNQYDGYHLEGNEGENPVYTSREDFENTLDTKVVVVVRLVNGVLKDNDLKIKKRGGGV